LCISLVGADTLEDQRRRRVNRERDAVQGYEKLVSNVPVELGWRDRISPLLF
jgi:hypothetical protein